MLAGAGYAWEEISNWARPGHECRHNHLYWEQGDYVGIGSAAHSHRDGRALVERAHARPLHRRRGGRPLARGRRARCSTADQRDFEALSLVAAHAARGAAGTAWSAPRSSRASSTRAGGRAVLTVRGRLLANEVGGQNPLRYPAPMTETAGADPLTT